MPLATLTKLATPSASDRWFVASERASSLSDPSSTPGLWLPMICVRVVHRPAMTFWFAQGGFTQGAQLAMVLGK